MLGGVSATGLLARLGIGTTLTFALALPLALAFALAGASATGSPRGSKVLEGSGGFGLKDERLIRSRVLVFGLRVLGFIMLYRGLGFRVYK